MDETLKEVLIERDRKAMLEAQRMLAAEGAGEKARKSVTKALTQLCDSEKNKSEFARKCGTTPQNVQNWLNGISVPPLDKIAEIAAVYGLPITALTGTEEGEHPVLVPDEEELLKLYRAMPSKTRRALMEIARACHA